MAGVAPGSKLTLHERIYRLPDRMLQGGFFPIMHDRYDRNRWNNRMAPLTSHGREIALEGLRKRRAAAQTQKTINNSALYAGSPMYYFCIGCGLQNIVVPENWITKPELCTECKALKDCGWLE